MIKKDAIVVGRQPVLDALKEFRSIEKILLTKQSEGEIYYQIIQLAAQNNVPVQYVPIEKLNYLTRINHQGVIAHASLVEYWNINDFLARKSEEGHKLFLLMLDGITDVRNIGGIARTAFCCGIDGIIIPDKGVGALNEDAMKSSAGALGMIPIIRVNSLLKTVDLLHEKGISVFVSTLNESKPLEEMDFTESCCIIMGSEGRGVERYLEKASDEKFRIGMKNPFDSYNVSVATGIILYEAMKQKLRTTQ